MLEGMAIAHSESMDLTNDPRFFTGNIIDMRLGAFDGLSVISGLLVGVAMDECNSMKKDIYWTHYKNAKIDNTFQLIGFALMTVVLFINIIATYVGVAQPYHTYRLMTSGPCGFEAAASYYLNKNIAWWRHFATKYMLASLPILAFSIGVRLVVKFDKDSYTAPDLPDHQSWAATFVGLLVMVVYFFMGAILYCLHRVHSAVFRERYTSMMEPVSDHLQYVSTLMNSYRGSGSTRFLDV